MKYDHLVGKPFIHGRQDCYEIVRRFYWDNFGIHLSNYARPDDWWEAGEDLYKKFFRREGFDMIEEPPRNWKVGDAFLISIRSPRINHAAIFIGDDKILHHFYGRRSEVTTYKGMWRERTCCMVRHRDMPDNTVEPEVHDAIDLLPEDKRKVLRDALDQ